MAVDGYADGLGAAKEGGAPRRDRGKPARDGYAHRLGVLEETRHYGHACGNDRNVDFDNTVLVRRAAEREPH